MKPEDKTQEKKKEEIDFSELVTPWYNTIPIEHEEVRCHHDESEDEYHQEIEDTFDEYDLDDEALTEVDHNFE